jgi:hypothetical protein
MDESRERPRKNGWWWILLETGVVSSGNDKTDQAPTKELSLAENHERQPETFVTVTKIEIQNSKTMTHAHAWAYPDSRNETHGMRRRKPSRTTTKPGEGYTCLLAKRNSRTEMTLWTLVEIKRKNRSKTKGASLKILPATKKEHENQFNCSRMRLKNSYLAAPNEVKNRIRTGNHEADQAARRSKQDKIKQPAQNEIKWNDFSLQFKP